MYSQPNSFIGKTPNLNFTRLLPIKYVQSLGLLGNPLEMDPLLADHIAHLLRQKILWECNLRLLYSDFKLGGRVPTLHWLPTQCLVQHCNRTAVIVPRVLWQNLGEAHVLFKSVEQKRNKKS